MKFLCQEPHDEYLDPPRLQPYMQKDFWEPSPGGFSALNWGHILQNHNNTPISTGAFLPTSPIITILYYRHIISQVTLTASTQGCNHHKPAATEDNHLEQKSTSLA